MVKKVLLVITKGDIGGAQVSVFNLAKQLRDRGVIVVVGLGSGNFLTEKLARLHITYVRFKYLRRSYNPLTLLRFIWEFNKYLNRENFDVVHCNSSNTLPAALAAKISRRPPKTVFTFRGLSLLDVEYRQPLPYRVAIWLYFKLFLRFVDEKVFVSKANQIMALRSKLTRDGHIIYNGLDPQELNFFNRTDARRQLENRLSMPLSDALLIGSIGRLSYQKNYEFLIRQGTNLQAEFPTLRVVIIGDGPEMESCRTLITKLQLSTVVLLAGAIPDAYRYLKAFDVFVLPSRYEGLSVTLIEALFAGIPIVASDVGGNREQLNGGAGILYPLDDSEKFVQITRVLLSDNYARDSLSQSALVSSNNSTINKTVEAYITLYGRGR